jgi:hypothetical protein
MNTAWKAVVRKYVQKRLLGLSKHKLKDNIKMSLKKYRTRELDLTGSGHRPVAGFSEHGDEKGQKFITTW